MLASSADVVCGSRFMRGLDTVPPHTLLANSFLTLVTNILYGAKFTDMETPCKVSRLEITAKFSLRCVRLDFEPEITAKLLRAGCHIVKVPASYTPRPTKESKKTSRADGFDATYTLLSCKSLP